MQVQTGISADLQLKQGDAEQRQMQPYRPHSDAICIKRKVKHNQFMLLTIPVHAAGKADGHSTVPYACSLHRKQLGYLMLLNDVQQ